VKPQHALTSVKDESTCDSTNTSAAHSRNRSPPILHRPLVDEIDIPMSLDDSYKDDDEDQGLPIESEAGSDEAGKPTIVELLLKYTRSEGSSFLVRSFL